MEALTEPEVSKTARIQQRQDAKSLLRFTFLFFFAQIVLLILLSFVRHQPPTFVVPFMQFGIDYNAFYVAAQNWAAGFSPYDHWRFVSPPFSLWAGLLFIHFSFATARLLYFALNVLAVLLSLLSFARSRGFDREATTLVAMIALTYYPFYYVIERGNLDGIILALLLWAYQSRNRIISAALLGLAMATKVYPVLILGALLRARRWWMLAVTSGFVLAYEAPLIHYAGEWIRSVTRRSGYFRFNENVSAAALFAYAGVPAWKTVFTCVWLISLVYVIWRADHREWKPSIVRYIPWMISMPHLVYIYCGVLYLAMLVMLAKQADERELTAGEKFVMAGFLFTGVQAGGFAVSFPQLWNFFYLAAPMGTALMMLGTILMVSQRERAEPVVS